MKTNKVGILNNSFSKSSLLLLSIVSIAYKSRCINFVVFLTNVVNTSILLLCTILTKLSNMALTLNRSQYGSINLSTASTDD